MISGIAWDGGYGISMVEISADGGKSWMEAALGEDLGKYAFAAGAMSSSPSGAEN